MASSSSKRNCMNDGPCKRNSKCQYSCTMDSASSSMNTATSISQYGFYKKDVPDSGCNLFDWYKDDIVREKDLIIMNQRMEMDSIKKEMDSIK
ncbi:hypothetical protein RIF29_24260 [Crotalaria pallida]|uniref:Uncharacterized protein n=1 Tax=Crotalaria pallida TaxID=3830 RepID=A0AAN9ERM3_CROPI